MRDQKNLTRSRVRFFAVIGVTAFAVLLLAFVATPAGTVRLSALDPVRQFLGFFVSDPVTGEPTTGERSSNQNSAAATVCVNVGGVGPCYPSITTAMNGANPGDTIQVAAGSYTENVTVYKAGVIIQGANVGVSAGATPGVRGAESIINGIFSVTAPDVTIDGFTITGGTEAGTNSGIFLNTGSDVGSTTGHIFQNNIIQRVGVPLPNSQGIVFIVNFNAGVSILNNEIFDWTTGIFINPIDTSGSVIIDGNHIHDNVAGVGSDSAANTTISNNLFENNDEGIGINTPGSNYVISDNEFNGNTVLIAFYGAGQPVAISGTSGNCAAIQGGTVYSTIQAAIDAAGNGDTINVCAGTYAENVTLNKDLSLNGAQAGIDARGRVASESIIAPPAGIALSPLGGSAGATIDGFTLSGGTRGIESTGGPINDLQILNNRIIGFANQGVFLNDPGTDITVDKNVIDGAGKTGSGGLFHLDTDAFNGFHLTNNNIVGKGATDSSTGFFVDGNHNVGPSAGRNPLISGNLITACNTGMNLGTRAFGSQTVPNAGTISNNTFSNNNFDGLQGGIQNTLITGNNFTGTGREGVLLPCFGKSGAGRGGHRDGAQTGHPRGRGRRRDGGAAGLSLFAPM